MIKGIEFTKSMNCDKDVAVQVAEFCNAHNITKDRIIDIKYTKANNGTCRASAMLIYESVPSADVVPKSAYDQVMWEYKVALEQLKEIGLSFAEKPVDVVKVVRCKDCVYHQSCTYEENFKIAKTPDEKMFCGIGTKRW